MLACCPSLCLVRENLSCLLPSLRPNLCRLLNCPYVGVRVRPLATYFVRAANVALKSSLRRRGGTIDDVPSFVRPRPSGDLFLNHLHR